MWPSEQRNLRRHSLILEGFRVGLIAGAQHYHKRVALRNATVVGIVDLYRLAAPSMNDVTQ
jgi:hypothetical protein